MATTTGSGPVPSAAESAALSAAVADPAAFRPRGPIRAEISLGAAGLRVRSRDRHAGRELVQIRGTSTRIARSRALGPTPAARANHVERVWTAHPVGPYARPRDTPPSHHRRARRHAPLAMNGRPAAPPRQPVLFVQSEARRRQGRVRRGQAGQWVRVPRRADSAGGHRGDESRMEPRTGDDRERPLRRLGRSGACSRRNSTRPWSARAGRRFVLLPSSTSTRARG
jgi:hypothetical protein